MLTAETIVVTLPACALRDASRNFSVGSLTVQPLPPRVALNVTSPAGNVSEVDVRNGEGGATVVVSLNGVEVNRVTDPDPLPAGGLALRNDHEGTVVKFQNLRIAR